MLRNLAMACGTVAGILRSRANASFTIEFFSNSACDSSGNGEGQTLTRPEPELAAERSGNQFLISWPGAVEPEFVLECTTNLIPPIVWRPATNQVVEMGDRRKVILDISAGSQFYRLAR
jgi:hypothetical protein